MIPESRVPNYLGQVFGFLTAIEYLGLVEGHRRWKCRCTCGNVIVALGARLKTGAKTSCGCRRGRNMVTHGQSKTKEYRSWCAMKRRCTCPKDSEWSNYGGRGITVCERWGKFENFSLDMGNKPTSLHTLERLDVNLPYTPENCKWATQSEQSFNKRNNRILAVDGVSKPLCLWAKEKGIHYATISSRIKTGWDIKDAVMTPLMRQRKKELKLGYRITSVKSDNV